MLNIGCECAQGYGIARPMESKNLSTWSNAWAQKAAAQLIKISNIDKPPLHYFLGADVYQATLNKISTLQSAPEEGKADMLLIGFK